MYVPKRFKSTHEYVVCSGIVTFESHDKTMLVKTLFHCHVNSEVLEVPQGCQRMLGKFHVNVPISTGLSENVREFSCFIVT